MADTYAYMGPAGTFSEEAALRFASTACADGVLVECASITEVFALVDSGRADYGVVPIENALEGTVNATVDALVFDRDDTRVLAETIVDIHQSLLLAPGATLADVTAVVSHPQATAQCRRWIAAHLPAVEVRAANSTAESARLAASDPTIAGIGSERAAELHGARVYEASIEDFVGNQTRFVLVGHGRPRAGERYKTSLALFMREDRPGTLLMILQEFAYAGFNLTKVESRPTKRALGDYMFIVDVDGHIDDLPMRTAVDSLKLKLREVKVLGSYPTSRRGDDA